MEYIEILTRSKINTYINTFYKMAQKINCNPGNKPCGRRCVPESYTCAGEGTSDINVTAEDKVSLADADVQAKGAREGAVTKKFARKKLKAMRDEAYSLAGGRKQYKKELNQMVRDTGGGMKANIRRKVMQTLAPELVSADDFNFYVTTKKKGKYEKQFVNKDRSKFKMSDMVRKGDKLKKGDVIRVRMVPANVVGGGFGYHYGVYLGNGRIVHYNDAERIKGKKFGKKYSSGVREGHLKDFNKAQNFKWEKVGVGSKYSPEELMERVKRSKGIEAQYNMMMNNCEHYAYLLTQGKAYSSQADANIGIAGSIVRTLFYPFQRYVLRGGKEKALGKKTSTSEYHTIGELKRAANFSERTSKPRIKQTKGNRMNSDFRMPTSEDMIMKDLEKAMMFAEETAEGDTKNQIGILSAWLKAYINNIFLGITD